VKNPNSNSNNNNLASTLNDNKEKKTIDGTKGCVKVEKAYSACHAGIMGVGNFEGRKNCRKEIEDLLLCVNPNVSLPKKCVDV